jgi:hypothetical protein
VCAHAREQLEQLCRYLLRPPVAQDRLRLTEDGRIGLELKSAWSDGTSHLVLEPLDLLARLAALTPRPRVNLIFYHGVLAPHVRWRAAVVMYGATAGITPVAETAPAAGGGTGPDVAFKSDADPSSPRRNWTWAQLMRRAFDVDVLVCAACGGRFRLVATIIDPRTIRAFLASLGVPSRVTDRAPPVPPARAAAAAVSGAPA